MHTVTLNLAHKLIATQFPQWQLLPIIPVNSSGTDHALFKLGNTMVIRLPKTENAAQQIDKELVWLPQLASCIPYALPTPLAQGNPTQEFSFSWSIYQWLNGKTAFTVTTKAINYTRLAVDLAQFITSLRKVSIANAPLSQRGGPLLSRDAETRRALPYFCGIIDVQKATALWEESLAAAQWRDNFQWVHGDLHPENILIDNGNLSAIIDFGLAGIGDPACDCMAAWTILSAKTRSIFRNTLNVDQATWIRGRGWALTFGLVAYPYYKKTNPILASIALRTIQEVLAE